MTIKIKQPKYVNGFVDRHGRPRYYLRRPGHKAVGLPGLLWSPTMMAAHEAAMKDTTLPKKSPKGRAR